MGFLSVAQVGQYRLGMELRPRPSASGPRTKPRATFLGRESIREPENSSVETLVSVPSSAMMTTRDEEFPPRVSPVQGGGARAFASSVHSESAGGAVRPPEGDPSRRSGRTLERTWRRGRGRYDCSTAHSTHSRKWGPSCVPRRRCELYTLR